MIRVLVVDDSAFMRASMTHILRSDKGIEVAGTADNGRDAVDRVKNRRPDVVLLDIDMPVMDGLTALSHIMAESPTPVVMLSGLDEKDARIAIKSLGRGAVDFIPKPSGTISYDIDKLRDEIIKKVKTAAEMDVQKISLELPKVSHVLHPSSIIHHPSRKIVVIGASTGGPRAVAAVLSGLSPGFPAALLVVQHMRKEFIPAFAERLKWESSLDISVAESGDTVLAGKVLIAPGHLNTTIQRDVRGKGIVITREAQGFSPSIDHAMKSAANAYGSRTLGVLLTGMGSDGAKGMKEIKKAGGGTIAEDESTCLIYGMPKAAIEMDAVDEVVPLYGIAGAIMKAVNS